jgi:hypothetical protein
MWGIPLRGRMGPEQLSSIDYQIVGHGDILEAPAAICGTRSGIEGSKTRRKLTPCWRRLGDSQVRVRGT